MDKYQAQKQVREKARAVAKVKLDAQRAAIDPVHNPRFLHRKPKSEVIPTPLHVLGRISPIFSPFFPVFCAFSPSRRDGSNEPQAGTRRQERAARELPPSSDTADA